MKKHLVIIALLSLAALPSMAQSRNDKGSYILGEFGISSIATTPGMESSAVTFGAAFGMHVDRAWAVETAYKDLGARSSGFQDRKAEAITFSAVGKSYLNRQWDLIGKVGLAHSNFYNANSLMKEGSSRTGFLLGAGLEYRVNRDTSFRLSYEGLPNFAGYETVLNNVTFAVKYKL